MVVVVSVVVAVEPSSMPGSDSLSQVSAVFGSQAYTQGFPSRAPWTEQKYPEGQVMRLGLATSPSTHLAKLVCVVHAKTSLSPHCPQLVVSPQSGFIPVSRLMQMALNFVHTGVSAGHLMVYSGFATPDRVFNIHIFVYF